MTVNVKLNLLGIIAAALLVGCPTPPLVVVPLTVSNTRSATDATTPCDAGLRVTVKAGPNVNSLPPVAPGQTQEQFATVGLPGFTKEVTVDVECLSGTNATGRSLLVTAFAPKSVRVGAPDGQTRPYMVTPPGPVIDVTP